MKRISYNWTKSIISTFSGDTYGENFNNMITNSELLPELNLYQRLLSINRIKLKCCQDNKEFYCCYSTRTTMSMKPIKNLSAPIKPREDLNHHQVITWTMKFTRWNWTTDKLISSSFGFFGFLLIDNLKNVCCISIVLIQY